MFGEETALYRHVQMQSRKNGNDDEDVVAESDSSQIVTFDDDLELESFCVWCAILKCKPYN